MLADGRTSVDEFSLSKSNRPSGGLGGQGVRRSDTQGSRLPTVGRGPHSQDGQPTWTRRECPGPSPVAAGWGAELLERASPGARGVTSAPEAAPRGRGGMWGRGVGAILVQLPVQAWPREVAALTERSVVRGPQAVRSKAEPQAAPGERCPGRGARGGGAPHAGLLSPPGQSSLLRKRDGLLSSGDVPPSVAQTCSPEEDALSGERRPLGFL